MRVRKYHGAGNDFVMITDLDGRLGPPGAVDPRLVVALCDRHTGVGADGLIRVISTDGYRMDYYNGDGGVAEMCGNGIRCLVAHERRADRIGSEEIQITTLAGPVVVRPVDGERLAVNMGTPGPAQALEVSQDGEDLRGTAVSMGNPHFVLFADEIARGLDDETVRGLGPRLEVNPAFPDRTNVEFVEIVDATTLRMRVWERGVGETLACGSGACAVTVAAVSRERTGPHVRVQLPGGELEVEWEAGGDIWLTGPAEEVFSAEIDTAWLEARGLTPALVEIT